MKSFPNPPPRLNYSYYISTCINIDVFMQYHCQYLQHIYKKNHSQFSSSSSMCVCVLFFVLFFVIICYFSNMSGQRCYIISCHNSKNHYNSGTESLWKHTPENSREIIVLINTWLITMGVWWETQSKIPSWQWISHWQTLPRGGR